jgi:hypothetical protein
MSEFPNYKARLKNRWEELRSASLSEKALMKRIDDLELRILSGAERNYKMRPLPEPETPEVHVKNLREWIRRRLTFMDQWMKNLEISKN